MGIYREVYTDVTCDKCGEQILAWKSCGQGVSKEWAKHYARVEGATVGTKSVTCKECRIKERQEKCRLIKKIGYPGQDGEERCVGFGFVADCKRCIAFTGFDWDEEAQKFKF